MSQFTADDPSVFNSPEANHVFILTINPAEYWNVIEVRKLSKRGGGYDAEQTALNGCPLGKICDTATPYKYVHPQ